MNWTTILLQCMLSYEILSPMWKCAVIGNSAGREEKKGGKYKPALWRVFYFAWARWTRKGHLPLAKAGLSNRGLGPSSVTCDVNILSVHDNLIECFPLLPLASGYELFFISKRRRWPRLLQDDGPREYSYSLWMFYSLFDGWKHSYKQTLWPIKITLSFQK